MLKKRIILTLFHKDGFFCLSRNFNLQKVGDINWLVDQYTFSKIVEYIDELVIINLSGDLSEKINSYLKDVEIIISKVFLPLTLGGGIRNEGDVENLFKFGADKVLVNSSIINNETLIRNIANRYGSQSITASIDYKKIGDNYMTYINNGSMQALDIDSHIKSALKCNVGELLLTSIDKDGTGKGLDLNISMYLEKVQIPIVLCGGAGKPEHFENAFKLDSIKAVSTANLFNFMGDSLEKVKEYLIKKEIELRI